MKRPALRTWVVMGLIALMSLAMANWVWDAKSREYAKTADAYRAQAQGALTLAVRLEEHIQAQRRVADPLRAANKSAKRQLADNEAILATDPLPRDEVTRALPRSGVQEKIRRFRPPLSKKEAFWAHDLLLGDEWDAGPRISALHEESQRLRRELARIEQTEIPATLKRIAEREKTIARIDQSVALMSQELRRLREHPGEQYAKAAHARDMAAAYERAARYPWLGAPSHHESGRR
jgi:hypothetical protein